MPGEHREIVDGTLSVRVLRDGDDWAISLRGELDLANVQSVERELHEALRDERGGVVLVDMRELEFIDSTGISLLFTAIERDGVARRLRFIASESPAVVRVLELTGVTRRMLLAQGDHDATAG